MSRSEFRISGRIKHASTICKSFWEPSILRIVIIAVFALGVYACGEEESSICEVAGPCEQFMLLQCECCANGDRVDGGNDGVVAACQQDKQLACETGRLTLNQSPENCASNVDSIMQYRAAGMDFCEEIDGDQLEALCYEAAAPQSMSEDS